MSELWTTGKNGAGVMLVSTVRQKLEEKNEKFEQTKTRLATARRDLKEAENELKSVQLTMGAGLVVFVIITILALIFESSVFVALALLVLFGGVASGIANEEPYKEKVKVIKSNISNINYVIRAIESSIEKINAATDAEENLDYRKAIKLFDQVGLSSEAKRIRTKMQEEGKVKVDQTVVHGDYVDDRDTIVKDSVLNRSNVGAGGKTKGERIKLIKELLDSGAIDDDEFKQMKKEILGK